MTRLGPVRVFLLTGDITGLSVMEMGCGEGRHVQNMLDWGASKVSVWLHQYTIRTWSWLATSTCSKINEKLLFEMLAAFEICVLVDLASSKSCTTL